MKRILTAGVASLVALTIAGSILPVEPAAAQGRPGTTQFSPRGNFVMRGGVPFIGGQRGFRDRRPGFRQFNGFWFPPSAFIAGAIVGGAIRTAQVNNAHIQWCQNRFRSYRVSDNTWLSNSGVRRQCISPFS